MLISEFVKKYKNTKQKDSLVSSIIDKKYISYATKVDLSNRIVNTCSYKEINGKKMFVLNSPMRYILFVRSIIEQYTKLEFDKIPDTDLIDLSRDIDLLEESHSTKAIITAIGEDVDAFSTILNLVLDDAIDNNRSMVSFLETKVEAFSIVADSILKSFDDPKVKEKIIQFINERKE